MENKICVLLPTRKRLEDFKLCADSWVKTTEGKSVVVVCIDYDDDTYDKIIEQNIYPFIYERQESKPFLHLLNDMAIRYAEQYECVAFMEDDCTYNTNGWETSVLDKINEIGGNAIVWCNDLVNYDSIVGLPFMNSNIIRTLGWMVNPRFHTLFADHYWMFLGKKLNSLFYFPDIIVEHRHYSKGERERDEISIKVEEESRLAGESQYKNSPKFMMDIENDVRKLRK